MKAAALSCAALALLAAIFMPRAVQKMPDFEVYWRAGERAASSQPLYPADDGHYQLKYLPAFAILMMPLAQAPLPTAKAVWFIASAVALGTFVAMSIAVLPDRRKHVWVLATCVAVAMAKFYGHELVLGQINLFFGVSVLCALWLLKHRHDFSAGALLALAVVLKPYAVLFFPWLVALGRWRALSAGAAAMAVALMAPTVVYGVRGTWALHLDWWRTVTSSTAPNLLNPDNVSIAAMWAKWLGPQPFAAVLAVVTTIAVLLVAAEVIRRGRTVSEPLALEAAMLLTLMPLVSPQGWDYVFLLATPAVVLLVNYEDRLPGAWRWTAGVAIAIAAFSLFDVMGRRAYATFMALSIVTICFLVVVGALRALRMRLAA